MEKALAFLSGVLWSAPSVFLLFALFFWISLRAGVPQRALPRAFAASFRGGGYAALSIHLSAVLGVGNIAGMAAAVSAGGPGAVFWVFVSGVLGSGVQFAESLVCIRFAERGKIGPMYVLRALGFRKSAAVYAAGTIACALLIGAAIPSGATVQLALPALSAKGRLLAGAAFAALCAPVLMRGEKGVGRACALLVPPMLFVYLLILGGILFASRARIGAAAALILREAFSLRPALCGAAGWGISRAMHWGCARGLFSSEAGLGTAGIAAQAQGEGESAERALRSACGAVIDTVLLASLTGFAFVAAALHTGCGFSDAQTVLSSAFSLFPRIGDFFIRICVTFLAFSTIIGWYWIARSACLFFPDGGCVNLLPGAWLAVVLLGPVLMGQALWSLCDIGTISMLAPNLFAVMRALPACRAALRGLSHGRAART